MTAQAQSSREMADDALEVCDTRSAHGLGVRTLVARRRGEAFHRFTGVISAELRQHSLQVTDALHISDTQFIGYLSHSCAPNCRLDMDAFDLVALCDIPAGARLTIDYAETEDRLFRQFACHCGAAACRNWITGRREGPTIEGQAYLAARRSGT